MYQKSPDGTGGCHSTTCTGPGGEHGDNEALAVGVKDACAQLCNSQAKTLLPRVGDTGTYEISAYYKLPRTSSCLYVHRVVSS